MRRAVEVWSFAAGIAARSVGREAEVTTGVIPCRRRAISAGADGTGPRSLDREGEGPIRAGRLQAQAMRRAQVDACMGPVPPPAAPAARRLHGVTGNAERAGRVER